MTTNEASKGALPLHLSTVYFSHLPYIQDQLRKRIPYSREQKHVSISDTPILLIEINSISNMGCQK